MYDSHTNVCIYVDKMRKYCKRHISNLFRRNTKKKRRHNIKEFYAMHNVEQTKLSVTVKKLRSHSYAHEWMRFISEKTEQKDSASFEGTREGKLVI